MVSYNRNRKMEKSGEETQPIMALNYELLRGGILWEK
jgi:hypothetical protein